MQRFTPRFQGRPWTEGMDVLHVYLTPRPGTDVALLGLAHACRPALLDYPIDPACPARAGDPGTLHVTLEMVADAPAADIGVDERQDLIRALRSAVADVPAFTTEIGPPIANVAGAVFDVWPDDKASALQDRVRTAIRTARGDAALQHDTGRLHMSLGYAYDTADSDSLNGILRNRITPRRAPMRVDAIHLLSVRYDIAPDTGGWRMSWAPVAELPLGGPA